MCQWRSCCLPHLHPTSKLSPLYFWSSSLGSNRWWLKHLTSNHPRGGFKGVTELLSVVSLALIWSSPGSCRNIWTEEPLDGTINLLITKLSATFSNWKNRKSSRSLRTDFKWLWDHMKLLCAPLCIYCTGKKPRILVRFSKVHATERLKSLIYFNIRIFWTVTLNQKGRN